MRRSSVLVVVIAVVAVVVAVAVDGDRASAYPDGWAGGCGACHGGSATRVAPAAHNVPAHQSFWSTCTRCHASVPGDSPSVAKCGGCHGGVLVIAASPSHAAAGCAAAGCHAQPTTTSSTNATTTTTHAATTTTRSSTTTSTATTTTTPPPTTTTSSSTSTSTTTTSSTTSTTAPPASFADVPPTHPYRDAIAALAGAGVVEGYEGPDGSRTFRPDEHVRRQQFAKMIVEALSLPVSEGDECPFPDVEVSGPGSLYPDNYVAAAALRGITRGTSALPPRFSPWLDISRAQVVTMVVRSARSESPGGLAEPPLAFSGILPADDPTHGANLRTAEWNGLLDGIEGPGPGLSGWDVWAPATRGETAQILWNLRRR